MSDLRDITSLSDILNTSPQKPSPRRNGRNVSSPQTNILEGLSSEAGPAKISLYDDLIQQQQQKQSVFERRQELLEKRTALRIQVEEHKQKLKALHFTKTKLAAQSNLESLLNQNNAEFTPELSNSLDLDKNDVGVIMKQLNVLPSNNWVERLTLIRRFCPYVEVDKVDVSSSIGDDNKLRKVYMFTIISPLLFRLTLRVTVGSDHQRCEEISLIEDKKSSLLLIRSLSPSFADTIAEDYIRNQKISHVLYGVNSLSITLHTRIKILHELIRKFRHYIPTKSVLSDLAKDNPVQSNLKLYAILKTVDMVELVVPATEERPEYHVGLSWQISLSDPVLSRCESVLMLSISNRASGVALAGVNDVYATLLKDYDPIHALCIIFRNVFGLVID